MKVLPLTLCAILLSFSALAQNLSLRKLKKLRRMDSVEIDQKLKNKGWSFISDAKPSEKMMGKAVWAFNPTAEGAAAWCVLYYSDTSPSRILYNLYEGNSIQKIQKKIRRRNPLPIAEGHTLKRVEQLESYADYPVNDTVLRLLHYIQPGADGVKIFDKSDYLKATENGRL
ncbi:hypothetical protein MKJ04_13965 [Pontibacter sp. E15-1]|uniref:hypothetical protein n=1 Tax=Pontibacter sp. E15-1 TaxID=2919918 RepID=UPI001F503CC2|nr:hypothetical protein [Pontibacter sp. E15-1]MCJ8165951.1 hypothetical protein [Pontibacter sp. E15-1]